MNNIPLAKLMDLGAALDAVPKKRQNWENRARDYVKDKLDKARISIWHPVDEIHKGIPDARYFSTDKNPIQKALWVEYKHMSELPVRDTTKVKPSWSSDLQRITLTAFARAGDNCRAVLFYGQNERVDTMLVFIFKTVDEWTNGVPVSEIRKRSMSIQSYIALLNKMFTGDEK